MGDYCCIILEMKHYMCTIDLCDHVLCIEEALKFTVGMPIHIEVDEGYIFFLQEVDHTHEHR